MSSEYEVGASRLGSAGVLVHEWLSRAGGSENVFESFRSLYPAAASIVLWNDDTARFAGVSETWLAKTPLRRSKAIALPFMPFTWRHLPFGPYEWAILSSHAFAHHARFRGPQPARYVYVHSPARYIWTPDIDARGNGRVVRLGAAPLRVLDRARAHEGASFASNSKFVQRRVFESWGVESQVINPPVRVAEIQSVEDWSAKVSVAELQALAGLPQDFLLAASRFIPYKRIDLALRAAAVLNRHIVVAGAGPLEQQLRSEASKLGVSATFVIGPSTAMLRALYQRTSLYIFPAVEDFGIMPVEAMAAGAPVLAVPAGGSVESVEPGLSGALCNFEDVKDIKRAASEAESSARQERAVYARRFDEAVFAERVRAWVGR